MRKNAFAPALLVCTFLVIFTSTAFGFEPFVQTVNAEGFKEVRAENGMVVQWRVENTRLHVILQAPSTGWVGIGFHPDYKMQGANFIIGYVRRGEVIITDHFGTRKDRHDSDTKLDGSEDVTVIGGSEEDGKTTVEFTIPLASDDSSDKPLVPGESTPILLAYGPQDNFTKVHTIEAEAKGDITL
jgi:hypothetical protein